jgi:hypothetical protein
MELAPIADTARIVGAAILHMFNHISYRLFLSFPNQQLHGAILLVTPLVEALAPIFTKENPCSLHCLELA